MQRDFDFIPFLGNKNVIGLEKVAFLASRVVIPGVVMRAYDWATEMRDAGVCVIGGFQSPLERDVLKFLLKGGRQPVVMALARAMWKRVPAEWRGYVEEGRLLVVSPVAQSAARVSEATAMERNRWVLANCSRAVLAGARPGGMLAEALMEFPGLEVEVMSAAEPQAKSRAGARGEGMGDGGRICGAKGMSVKEIRK